MKKKISTRKSSTRKLSTKKSTKRKPSKKKSTKRKPSTKKSTKRKPSTKKFTKRKSPTRCEENKIMNPSTNRCVNKNGKIGKNILKTKNYKFVKQPIPPSKKQSSTPFVLPKQKTVAYTNYKGTPWSNLVDMLYLSHLHKNDCVVIPDNYDTNVRTPKYYPAISLEWHSTDTNRGLILVPKGFWKALKECENSSKRFIIFPFGFSKSDYSDGHANYMIYDKKDKSLERFEPNKVPVSSYANPKNLDKEIKSLFDFYMPDFVQNYYAPTDYCPVNNFQYIQVQENVKKEGDPGGFCQPWSVWYADLRLSNPNKSRKDVIKLAMKKIEEKEPKAYTKFIRNYAQFIQKVGEELKQSRNPKETFKQYV